jgi:hypothetical protein
MMIVFLGCPASLSWNSCSVPHADILMEYSANTITVSSIIKSQLWELLPYTHGVPGKERINSK